jgi:hypothetical protein
MGDGSVSGYRVIRPQQAAWLFLVMYLLALIRDINYG